MLIQSENNIDYYRTGTYNKNRKTNKVEIKTSGGDTMREAQTTNSDNRTEEIQEEQSILDMINDYYSRNE